MANIELNVEAFSQFNRKWALLAAGSMGDCNAMTVSWGGMGTIWNKPVVTVYVRHSRYLSFVGRKRYFHTQLLPRKV